jgi:hypothetical protein
MEITGMRLGPAFVLGLLALGAAATAAAQATGTPTFNAPYRAFTRSEFGATVSFPSGGSTGVEGMYRIASGKFDLGFKVGFLDRDGGDAVLLAGVEARQRVITHNADFPLDGALVVGVGAWLGDATLIFLPVGLSLGRRIAVEGSALSIVPYLQPTLTIIGGDNVGDNVAFTLGLGADFRFTPRFDGRLSAGLGDLDGVSLGFFWLH